MKKTLLALACATLLAPAFAGEIQLYGNIDEFVAVNNTQGRWKAALMSGGATATHWGLKGSEEIADGVEVYFNLDNAFLINDGALTFGNDGVAFSREADLGIRGKWGSFSMGRQYTPHFLVFAMYDPTELSLGSSDSPYFFPGPASVTGADGNLVRANNSFMFTIPTPFGITNFLYLALGESDGSNKVGNIYNYAAKFDYGDFSGMISYLYRNVGINGNSHTFANQYINVALSYDFGVTKPVIGFTKKFTNDRLGEGYIHSDNFYMFQIGTSTPLWGGKWMISGSYMHNQSVKKANAWSLGTKYAYPISKRTRIYGGIELLFNGRNAGYAIEAGPDSSLHFNFDQNTLFSGYGTDYLGKNVQQIFIGLNHAF